MSSLHWPNAFLEPVEQRQIVGGAAEYGLAKVNVRLNETRKDNATSRINDSVSSLARLSDCDYPAVTDKQIARHDGILLIHRQQRSAFNEN